MRAPRGYYRCRFCKTLVRGGTICSDCAEEQADQWPDEDAEYEREREIREDR